MAGQVYDALAEALLSLVKRADDGKLTDRRRISALLSDLVPDGGREIRVLMWAFDNSLFDVIESAPADNVGLEIDRLAIRIENNLGARKDIAMGVLQAAAFALDRGPLPSAWPARPASVFPRSAPPEAATVVPTSSPSAAKSETPARSQPLPPSTPQLTEIAAPEPPAPATSIPTASQPIAAPPPETSQPVAPPPPAPRAASPWRFAVYGVLIVLAVIGGAVGGVRYGDALAGWFSASDTPPRVELREVKVTAMPGAGGRTIEIEGIVANTGSSSVDALRLRLAFKGASGDAQGERTYALPPGAVSAGRTVPLRHRIEDVRLAAVSVDLVLEGAAGKLTGQSPPVSVKLPPPLPTAELRDLKFTPVVGSLTRDIDVEATLVNIGGSAVDTARLQVLFKGANGEAAGERAVPLTIQPIAVGQRGALKHRFTDVPAAATSIELTLEDTSGARIVPTTMVTSALPAAPPPPSAVRDCADCPEVVRIAVGEFQMGADAAEEEREAVPTSIRGVGLPRKQVTIAREFWMGRAEVTVAQFRAFVEATRRDTGNLCTINNNGRWENGPGRNWRNPNFAQDDNHPVVCVAWQDAVAYTEWLTQRTGKKYRLPTEAEWEFAARAGTSSSRYWGDDRAPSCKYANVADTTTATALGWPKSAIIFECNDNQVYTAPVGSFAASAAGLFDMLGNVWEWTADCWVENLTTQPGDGTARNAANCNRRTIRGGSWEGVPSIVRAGHREPGFMGARTSHIGFRVVRE
jgi:formylglycine-generating enzyme required for sulfatase activity